MPVASPQTIRPDPVEAVEPPTVPVARPKVPAEPIPIVTTLLFEESGFETPVVPAADRPAILAAAAAEVSACRRCPHLAATRTQTVFGAGNPTARLMFVGEAPGADEDRIGQPFVGRAGQLLTDMITKGMGLPREEVYIANVLKCRPPDNRTPTPEEASNCSSYLEHQIAVIRPEFLCLLGKTAALALLDILPTTTMASLRQTVAPRARDQDPGDVSPVLLVAHRVGQEGCMGGFATSHERNGPGGPEEKVSAMQ